MKEIQTILEASARLAGEKARAVLATVVDVQGSGYRLPGAKMLITENGDTYGTVSGGCLEADVLERTRTVLEKGEPVLLTYDTRDRSDSVFSLNMGCNGIVRILLEPAENNSLFEFLEHCIRTRKPGVSASLIASTNKAQYRVGTRFLFDESTHQLNEESIELVRYLISDAKEILANGQSQCRTYETRNGQVEFFLETIAPPVNLIIFGAGYDAIPVERLAKYLGWRVSVVDHRPAFATRERFPEADDILLLRPENLHGNLAVDKHSVAVVMTHNYSLDREILRFLRTQPLAYLGALGPRRRTEKLLQELADQNEDFKQSKLERLYAPIGLDIGGANPETIALSIIAEIQTVLANRQGGFLRNRQGSIYNRS